MSELEKPEAPPQRRGLLVPLWSAGVILLAVIAGWKLVSDAHKARATAAARHAARLEPAERGEPAKGGRGNRPRGSIVKVGAYLDRIVELSVKDTFWTADFFVWFVWRDRDFHPGDTFRVVDGDITKREKVKEEVLPDGSIYALYEVEAKVTKFFDVSRFPADDHLLTLRIEDAQHDETRLHFTADTEASGLSSRVFVPGYKTGASSVAVQAQSYQTSYGDPRLPPGHEVTYSQFIYGVPVARDGAGFYIKLFQGLYAAVAIAILVFFIKPTDVDPRFGLGVGALFAAIANCYITSSLLPNTSQESLADTVNSVAIFTIFLTLVQSTISLYLYDILDNPPLARRFDKASALLITPAYAVINLLIYKAAVA